MAIKNLALVTRNPLKAEEWQILLRPQAISVAQFLPGASTPEALLAQGYDLVCREQSSLVEPGTTRPAALEHLRPVEHLCQLQCWSQAGRRDFQTRRAGYLDATQAVPAEGCWDARFCDALSGLSYQEQSLRRGTRLSARSLAVEQLIEAFLPESKRSACLDEQHSLLQTILAHPCFAHLSPSLESLVAEAVSRGLKFSPGQTRARQVYFWPGISPLPSEPGHSQVDEARFLFQDLVHFLIGRLLPDGPMNEHQRQVLLVWAMVEEAVALMLADGFFLDELRRAGWDYDFDQHKGYPFFCSQGWQDQTCSRQALWASVRFFVLGDRSGFPHPEDARALRYFEEFERFSLGDWLWNERMCLHARGDEEFYQRWWRLAEPLNRRHQLQLLNLSAVAAQIAAAPPEQLVANVFDFMWNHRLQPAPQLKIAQLSLEEERQRSQWRWLAGQMGFFAAFPEDEALARAARLLSQAPSFQPEFLEQCLRAAVERGLCSPHQARRWGQFFPLFPPYYISYKVRGGLSIQALCQRILGLEGGRKQLENDLDVVNAIICDRPGRRFLLERKVAHPDPMCDGCRCMIGGFRQHPEETVLNAWRREASEEWSDPESQAIAHQLADRAVPWRRFLVQGAERGGEFGMEVLLIELEEAEFESVARVLTGNNCSHNRPEGWPEVYAREEIAELVMLSGHQVVLSAFLEVGHSPVHNS
ncbi:MAG: hypothetical protein U0931_37750 [Vulcanimicrobiota bacterium]